MGSVMSHGVIHVGRWNDGLKGPIVSFTRDNLKRNGHVSFSAELWRSWMARHLEIGATISSSQRNIPAFRPREGGALSFECFCLGRTPCNESITDDHASS